MRPLLALTLLLPALARAQPSDASTSAAAPMELTPSTFPAALGRVEARQLVKARHFFLSAGPALLYRGDYFDSPGLLTTVAFYPTESTGFDLLAGLFHTTFSAAAQQIYDSLGWIPDARQPRALLQLGWRPTLAFGKTVAGNGTLVYFDGHLGLRGGLLLTDGPVAPMLTAAPGLLARINRLFVVGFEVDLSTFWERRRHGGMGLAIMPLVTVGVRP